MRHEVQFLWERRPSQPTAAALRGVIGGVLDHQGIASGEVHVLITSDEHIRELNGRFRDTDSATDVLSFPDGDPLPDGGVLLGQVVISLDTARRQAEEAGHGEMRELQELVLHGVLHLLGYDHSVDDGEMDDLEVTLRRELLA